ncbi:hypothetical protein EBR43_08865 [bacterium]|nr:hypothetical protein [bacterium]
MKAYKTYKKEDLLDKKILFANTAVNKFVIHEGKVNEFSPSGNLIKINHEWHFLDKIAFLDVFSEKERPIVGFVKPETKD